MGGIEYEIMESFKNYLQKVYKLSLTIKWIKGPDFRGTLEVVRESKQEGIFGASVFSITPERQKEVNFAPPYLSDITVLISSYDVPIAKDIQDFNRIFDGLTAITIEGTTYEKDLLLLKQEKNVDFSIQYIPSSENILRSLEGRTKSFGFIDLPIYLTEFSRNTAVRVKRQNLFPIKRDGYSFIYPKNSDWQAPLEEYFLSQAFKREAETIIGQYLDQDIYQFMESLYRNASDEEVILLTKEKEIQNRDLLGKSQQIKQETELRNLLIVGVGIVLFFLIIIYRLYYVRSETTLMLSKQKEQIEAQRQDIESKKTELEKRNKNLVELNEEKNHLIKILAHDLRSPINQISGFAQLIKLEDKGLTGDQKDLIDQITDATVRLNSMISKILDVDAVESNQVNLKFETIDLQALVRRVLNGFKKAADQKSINLTFNNPPETITLHSDELYLTQVLENLVSNALKFSPQKKCVCIQLTNGRDYVQIKVKDEGPGFTEKDQRNLFKKFQRLSAQPTADEQSTGLGLSIVKKYVELMNGKVWCESKPGEGATFIVQFSK